MRLEQLLETNPDGMAISDHLKTVEKTMLRDTCDELADKISLDQWCSLDEPYKTYVGWGITGEQGGAYGMVREFHLRILKAGVSVQVGFDRRNRRNIRRFKEGTIVSLPAPIARVVYKNFGPDSNFTSQRNSVEEVTAEELWEIRNPPAPTEPLSSETGTNPPAASEQADNPPENADIEKAENTEAEKPPKRGGRKK